MYKLDIKDLIYNKANIYIRCDKHLKDFLYMLYYIHIQHRKDDKHIKHKKDNKHNKDNSYLKYSKHIKDKKGNKDKIYKKYNKDIKYKLYELRKQNYKHKLYFQYIICVK